MKTYTIDEEQFSELLETLERQTLVLTAILQHLRGDQDASTRSLIQALSNRPIEQALTACIKS